MPPPTPTTSPIHQQEELLAEALAEQEEHKIHDYDPFTDASKYPPPLKQYILLGNFMAEFITPETGKYEPQFSLFIIIIICIAGMLVGIQTYDSYADDPTVNMMDFIILIIFTIEVLIKMIACGLAPWRYFTGPERLWNNFDFVVVLLCMPFLASQFGGGRCVQSRTE